MPSRLSSGRPRTSSRPPAPPAEGPRPTSSLKHGHVTTLDLAEDDWEPQQDDGTEPLTLAEIRSTIEHWEADLRARGRPVSGRTLVVVHSLPYVCTLHPTRPDAASPTTTGTSSGANRWVLHPRRGHAALNSGLKSLSHRALTVVGRPDNIRTPDAHVLPLCGIGPDDRHALEAGLKDMAKQTVKHDACDGAADESGIACVPVWLDDKVHSNFYEGMCKTYLWPIFHYSQLPESLDKKVEQEYWNAYYATNLVYAKKVAETYKPGDLVWIHDYHLLLVPRMLRELLPDEKPYISLFLHCPFPSSEYFRCLPRREEILDGMLGCNLVCFQTHSYARHFLSSCVRILGCEAGAGGVDAKGSITRIAHCPIGIDTQHVEADRIAQGVAEKIDGLRRLHAGKKIIVGRDKLDPTKGVLPKLRAFERFLREYPQWAQQVVLIQVTSPSPGDSPALATKVSEVVDHINAEYGSLQFQPVHHLHKTIERDEYFALLTVADVALITSTRDGMNTTSMEYIMCQKGAHGPLILSELTGVSAILKQAVKINPWDMGGVARAIDQCLTMSPAERAERHAQLYSVVQEETAAVWAAKNILHLLESLQGEQATQNTPPLDEQLLMKKFTASKKRLFMFDYDGTLTPIVKNPSAAVPSQLLLDSLATLTADPNNVVYIISGRDGDFLEQHLGHFDRLGLSAEHGCYIKEPGQAEWTSLTQFLDMSWKRDVFDIFKYYEARTAGAYVEKKMASVTFHYRNADVVFGEFQAKECQAMLESMQESVPIDILVGKKNVEVRPQNTNKGDIVQRLLYLHPETDFLVCAGDDKTDEDMFHAISVLTSSATPNQPIVVPPPDSMLLFPGLAQGLKGADGKDLPKELVPLQSRLEPESAFMLVIDGSARRMTLANYVLDSAEKTVDLLAALAKASGAQQ